jgi:hypothetical protein
MEQGNVNHWANGHHDGELWRILPDLTSPPSNVLVDYLDDGKKWGFEHKHIGRFGYLSILKQGFQMAEPVYMAQTLTYGAAQNWDAVLIVVMSQDASSISYEIKVAKQRGYAWAKNPDIDPKIMMFAYDLNAMKPLVAPLKKRADEIAAAAVNGELVAPEHDGKKTFPCGYCAVQPDCQRWGSSGIVVTPSPFGVET